MTAIPVERLASRRSLGRTLRLGAAAAGAPERAELEAFVADAFQRGHDATIASFMPELLHFRDPAGALRGVVGLRAAATHPLYLEQYLDRPIELAIAAATGRRIGREAVVEVGNLAGTTCRTAIRMVAQLPAYLLSRDYDWIVFTATCAVRQILHGFGAPLLELARADGARVAGSADRWGSYYDKDPRVFAGYLPASRSIPGFSVAIDDR